MEAITKNEKVITNFFNKLHTGEYEGLIHDNVVWCVNSELYAKLDAEDLLIDILEEDIKDTELDDDVLTITFENGNIKVLEGRKVVTDAEALFREMLFDNEDFGVIKRKFAYEIGNDIEDGDILDSKDFYKFSNQLSKFEWLDNVTTLVELIDGNRFFLEIL